MLPGVDGQGAEILGAAIDDRGYYPGGAYPNEIACIPIPEASTTDIEIPIGPEVQHKFPAIQPSRPEGRGAHLDIIGGPAGEIKGLGTEFLLGGALRGPAAGGDRQAERPVIGEGGPAPFKVHIQQGVVKLLPQGLTGAEAQGGGRVDVSDFHVNRIHWPNSRHILGKVPKQT